MTHHIRPALLDPGHWQAARIAWNGLATTLFDRTFALAALLVLLPFMLVTALLILMFEGRPIFFVQERVGRGGRMFRCYKFRTMVRDADERLRKILAEDARSRDEWAARRKLTVDPRVHCIGAFLRRTSLDELPQFWNILKGDMRLVGPRPVLREELSHYGEQAPVYLGVKPGLTGLWQVSGRSLTSYEERVKLDVEYCRMRSFLLDLRIVLKTVKVVLMGHGAR